MKHLKQLYFEGIGIVIFQKLFETVYSVNIFLKIERPLFYILKLYLRYSYVTQAGTPPASYRLVQG